MISSVHVYEKEKGEGPAQVLDNTTLWAEAKYPINFTQSGKWFMLSLHYNGAKIFLFVNATKVYEFKAKNSEIKRLLTVLGNVSIDSTINNMKKINRSFNFFSVDSRPIDNKMI